MSTLYSVVLPKIAKCRISYFLEIGPNLLKAALFSKYTLFLSNLGRFSRFLKNSVPLKCVVEICSDRSDVLSANLDFLRMMSIRTIAY